MDVYMATAKGRAEGRRQKGEGGWREETHKKTCPGLDGSPSFRFFTLAHYRPVRNFAFTRESDRLHL